MELIDEPIDIVITWVDGNDILWQKKVKEYSINNFSLNTPARYRDFGILKYCLRSIDEYLPWIHKVYLITDHQVPSYLNLNYEKLEIIDHREFIPQCYLPTFNSNVIELNLYRIKSLSEKFILMNDDMIIDQPMKITDFFQDEKVVDVSIFSPIFPRSQGIGKILSNNISILNDNFSKREFVKKNFFKVYNLKYGKRLIKNFTMSPYKEFSGFYDPHVPIPYFKTLYKYVLEERAYDSFIRTCNHKFRSELDINHWLVRYWQILTGNFVPRFDSETEYILMNNQKLLMKSLRNHKKKMLCINDVSELKNYEYYVTQTISLLEKKFPNKSKFEIRD